MCIVTVFEVGGLQRQLQDLLISVVGARIKSAYLI